MKLGVVWVAPLPFPIEEQHIGDSACVIITIKAESLFLMLALRCLHLPDVRVYHACQPLLLREAQITPKHRARNARSLQCCIGIERRVLWVCVSIMMGTCSAMQPPVNRG